MSDTTARFDRTVKRPRYAGAGIAEMWLGLVDLAGGVVEVAREPTQDGYACIDARRPGEMVAPAAFPDLAVAVADLVG